MSLASSTVSMMLPISDADRAQKFYDTPDLKTVDHIATMGGMKAAWFLDPHGNVLCVHQTG